MALYSKPDVFEQERLYIQPVLPEQTPEEKGEKEIPARIEVPLVEDITDKFDISDRFNINKDWVDL